MSMSPHQIFGRLHELKRWQQTHENLLRRANVDEDFEKTVINSSCSPRVSGNINETSLQNEKPSSLYSSFENPNLMHIKGAQGRNFEEILEEKLSEYANDSSHIEIDSSRPKKPFLKKGAGLIKYNLKLEEYKKLIGNKCSNTIQPHRIRPKSVQNSKKSLQNVPDRPKTSGQEKQSNLMCRSQNYFRGSNKTSSNHLQRSKATVSVNTKKVETLKVPNVPKIKKKLNIDQHSTEYNLKKLENSKDIQNVTKIPREPEVTEIDKTSPKLKDFIETIMKNSVTAATFTPLKAPDLSIKPKESWCGTDVTKFQNDNIPHKGQWVDSFQQSDINHLRNKFEYQGVVQSEWQNDFGKRMNVLANRMVQKNNNENVMNDLSSQESKLGCIETGARKSLSYSPKPSDQSLYEKALETELLIFEALERRTEQSGFCSTNTSIIQLLASSPSRFNFKNTASDSDHPIFDRIIDINEDIEDQPVRDKNVTSTPSSDRIETTCVESGLHHFQNEELSNWPTEDYLRLQKDITEESSEVDTETEEEIDDVELANSKYKHRKDASINTEGLSMQSSSYSSEHTDSSEDRSVESDKTYKTCKLPESVERRQKISESCTTCGFLINKKIEECESELNNLKIEKNRIVAIREQMTKDKKEFEREMKTRKKQFDEQRRHLEMKLEEERRRSTEKIPVEKPYKEIKLKLQQKKDKEELSNLKIELNETKELMKLRETKNAMSLARLRNQVKLLEKNNAELKAENEKLLKEKSKLVAQQKTYNKSTETKMLKEISKNISKLTEEKFKNRLFKPDTSSEDLIQGGCKGDSGTKSTKSKTGMNKIVAFSCHGHGEGPVEENYTNQQNLKNSIEDESIEEKYRSLFGGQDVILENISKDKINDTMENSKPTGLSKTEKLLDDGTKEILYSNGNMKLISENGTIRYYYANNDTWHTNFTDGTEVLEFPNGQSEKRFKDGKCLIFFPDGLLQTIFPNGTEEVKYPDGSKLVTKKDGERMLFLSNGQVEIHTKDQKRREYPDGTVKILYPDGSQETRYSNGRIRVKNNEGEIILDTGEDN